MKMKKNILAGLVVCAGVLVAPLFADAISGVDVKNTKVKVYAEQGGDWFKTKTKRTDRKSVLEVKNVLPGWYKFSLRGEDQRDGQLLAIRAKMVGTDGRKIKKETSVNLFVKVGESQVAIGTVQTDKKGWLELSGLSFDTEYLMDIDEKNNSSVGKKEGKARIAVKAQIGDSAWFDSFYGRTDENYVLEIGDVLPGKYKFKYKNGDRDPALPFTLKIKMSDEKGKRIREATAINLYAYMAKTRVLVGTVMTDADGNLTIPGIMSGGKYKIEIAN